MLKLGILFGGASFEHDISIISAFQLKKRIENQYEIHMYYLTLEQKLYSADKMKLQDFKKEKLRKMKKISFEKVKVDAMIGCMHGENGEDGLAKAVCDFYHIRYFGCGLFAASTAMDKGFAYAYLSKHRIPMLKSIVYTFEDYLNHKKIPFYPCILKPTALGSSLGIAVCQNEEEFDAKIVEAFRFGNRILVQKYLQNVTEYNLALTETAYSNLERIHKKDEIFSFSNKYTDSFKQIHQSLIEDQRYEDFCKIGRKVYQLLNCEGIIRIDFFLVEDQIIVNEINPTPGALAMYLFPDFETVFQDSLNRCLRKEKKNYPQGQFLKQSNIQK